MTTEPPLTPEALDTIEARDGLANMLPLGYRPPQDKYSNVFEAADAILASEWMAAHDANVRAHLEVKLRRLRTENEEVRALHHKATRYTREDCTGSFESMDELHEWEDDYDGPVGEFFVCGECGRLEAEAHENDDDWDYIASAWPCPTSRAALDAEVQK